MRNTWQGERGARVEGLFLQAAELPPHEREEFLSDRCGDDLPLRDEVLSLLRYDTAEESPLLDALTASAASLVGDDSLEGGMLGPYRLEREIGRGGMSVVYSALRADGEFTKRVAIKIIKRGMDTRAVVERLRRERGILAALEHPSIARLLDGGTTPDGRPWIAMEYVEGLPIDRFCDEHNLSVEDRCQLIDKVCDAVAYAHRNLVVHRDLKPSNILVAPDGNPKLLDFGIAKLLTESGEDGDGPLTRGFVRPFTPEYASPEQMRGGAVGTATDIYSLGVVFFELLAGSRPATEGEKASDAALRTGKGNRRARRLAGDVDNILQMTLRTEPERRYLTIGQLQADLRLYLIGLPVSARRETVLYRFGKLIRRHPFGTPAAAVVTLAAIAGVAFIVKAEREAQFERRKAEQRLGQMVELANRALFDVHDSIAGLAGATPARLAIVRATVAYLDRLNADSGNDVRVLAALASAYTRVARVQGSPLQPNLGDLSGAEANYAKAVKIVDSLVARGADDTKLQLQDAELRTEFGVLLRDTGNTEKMAAQYNLGIGRVGLVLARDPRNLPALKIDTTLRLDLAYSIKDKDPAGARRTAMELLPVCERVAAERPEDTDWLQHLASIWSIAGSTYGREHNLARSADAYRKSASLRERFYALEPGDVQAQRDLLIAYGHLGDLTGSPMFPGLGDYAGAVVWYTKAVEMADRMYAADPSNAQARNDLGTALGRVGISQTAAGMYRDALETLQRAETLLAPLRSASPTNAPLALRVALVFSYRGHALQGLGENAAAAGLFRRSIAICESLNRAHPDASCRQQSRADRGYFAVALASAGETGEALREARSDLEDVQKSAGDQPSGRSLIARVLELNGRVDSILAKRAAGAESVAHWRAAADNYRKSVDLWRGLHWTTEPYIGLARDAGKGLDDANRALSR